MLLSPVYPIIDCGICAARGIDPIELTAACIRGGARLLQIRQKTGSSAAFLVLAESAVALARSSGAAVIVNDRADIARLAGAAGVHVGQDDLPIDAALRIVGERAMAGLSTHTEAQVDAALAGPATYVAVGPVFGTSTKDTGYAARGLDLVRYAARRGKPIVAIGGMTLASAPAVIDAGATSVAVVSDLLETGDPEQRVREYVYAFG